MFYENICDNISISPEGHLLFAGQDTVELAQQYGTPLYLMDENKIREKCRIYKDAFRQYFPEGSLPVYASKACAFMQICRIAMDEGMGIDVVSPGEIYTAVKAGFPMEKAFFHSNNKTDEDIRFALDKGVGCFVIDNEEEILALEREAAARGIRQKALLRITPGIDPHTYEEVTTGRVDSKFGLAIATGQAEEAVRHVLAMPHIELEGFHTHVGSQVFFEDVFERTAAVMADFIADMREKTGYTAAVLNLGGGYGVPYVAGDPPLDIAIRIRDVAEALNGACRRRNLPVPAVIMEPGRSIVADAGMTLYTVGTVKHIPGYKDYVSIDGGMADNPRYILYKASYTCIAASRADEPAGMKATLTGRCCESGDVIQENVFFPRSLKRGDIVAVCTTGAYNYAMSSNYNRIPRPPVVMLKDGGSYVAVKRETFEDLCRNDV